MMDFSGKTVLITGSTGQLGKQFCMAFANKGAGLRITGVAIDPTLTLVVLAAIADKKLHVSRISISLGMVQMDLVQLLKILAI